jgi:quercetin dioxygenase-like cupin family protein
MPKGERQEVRVFAVTVKPGDKTPFHSHRFPVTVYVLEGVLYPGDGGARSGHVESR